MIPSISHAEPKRQTSAFCKITNCLPDSKICTFRIRNIGDAKLIIIVKKIMKDRKDLVNVSKIN